MIESPKVVKSEQAHLQNFSNLTLDQYHNIVVDAARGRVVEAPMYFFQDPVLRDISADDVKAVHQRLVKNGAITTDGRWAQFKKAPSAMRKAGLLAEKKAASGQANSEDLAYEKLLVVYSTICEAAAEKFGEEATVAFVSRRKSFDRSSHTNGYELVKSLADALNQACALIMDWPLRK